MEISFCSHLRYTELIIAKFCTQHNSADMAYAKFGTDTIADNGVHWNKISIEFELRLEIDSEMGPWT